MSPIPILSYANPFFDESRCSSLSYWISYVMRLLPTSSHWLSLSLVFLLAFGAEFCALLSSIKKQEGFGVKTLLCGCVVHALRVFMAYLVIICVLTTDFSFFFAAILGHVVGHLAYEVYQFHVDQEMFGVVPSSDDLLTKL